MQSMKRFEMEVPYIKASNDLIQDMFANVMRHATPELEAILKAGCQMETIIEDREKVIVRTVFPVSILKDDKGNIISLIEKRI
jgi:hypothetical protein